MRPREYDPQTIIELCREHDGITTSELAEAMDARLNTTWYRCCALETQGILTGWKFGAGPRGEVVWHVVEE